MTGFEYTAAVGMLYEGMDAEGLACIQNVRDRYDGLKRSAFDEAECGHHYARAMAAWAAVLALSGFHYSAVAEQITFASNAGDYFWSTGYGFGSCKVSRTGDSYIVRLNAREGTVRFRTVELQGAGSATFPETRTLRGGDSVEIRIQAKA